LNEIRQRPRLSANILEERELNRGSGPCVVGKHVHVAGRRALIKGVAYGTFAPDAGECQFPSPNRIAADFTMMAAAGINTVRTYTPPPEMLLDVAARHGLSVMVGLPCEGVVLV